MTIVKLTKGDVTFSVSNNGQNHDLSLDAVLAFNDDILSDVKYSSEVVVVNIVSEKSRGEISNGKK